MSRSQIENKNYIIEMVSKSKVIIFCTSYINTISCLDEIEIELNKVNFAGTIIFDLLLANGYTSNRFIRAKFFNSKIQRTSMEVIKSLGLFPSIADKINSYYRNNPEFIKNSILSEKEQTMLI